MTKTFKNYWPILILLILSIFIIWPIFRPGYFSHHDDLHVMRIFEMKKCLQDFQIPCRWVPDMGYGNGYPLFNYYNPFPYYIGGILSFFTGFIISAKILFLIPLILGGVSMYLLVKEILNKEAGLLAGVLYMFAPYKALDSYVRGAVAESFAMAIIPLVLYFAYKLEREKTNRFLIFFSFSLAAFLTSHTIMTLLFLPVLIFFIPKKKSILLASFLGIGLSAFFILPAFFEKNLVQIDNLTSLTLDFRAHFITVSQLFLDRSWGYENLSFQIGLPHWILAFLSIPMVLVFKRKERKMIILYLGVLLIFLFSIFMTHNKSAFIWEQIGLLRFAQFPWRFLAVAVFSSSLLGGFLIYSLPKNLGRVLGVILIGLTVFLNWNYFRPNEFFFNLTDQDKLSGSFWETQQKAAIKDYLPVGAQVPLERAEDLPLIEAGEADIKLFERKSNSFKLNLDVKSASRVELPIMDFPNWKVYENKKVINHSNDNYVKRISLNLEPGEHKISGKFTNTPLRTIANTITLLSILYVIYLSYAKNKKDLS